MTRTEQIEALKAKAQILRSHSIRSTTEAGSGHPTTCLSAADLMSALFFYAFRYDVPNPDNPRNDHLVLSKGHASPLQYAAWAEAGAFPVDHLMTLRKVDSDLEGHATPRFRWYGAATGSLGQGLSISVGVALALRLSGSPATSYCFMGDGESAEGSVWEAAALASYYQLSNLTLILDVNRLGQSQATMLQHDLKTYSDRFRAFGWRVIEIDGHDMNQIVDALDTAKLPNEQPTAIIARTFKGRGVSFLEDKEGWHGKPLPTDLAQQAVAELAVSQEQKALSAQLKVAPPAEFSVPSLPAGAMEPPAYTQGQQVATREAYGDALVALGRANGRVIALDGDVKNSTYSEKFYKAFPDRFVECFIAEQNMVGAAIGLAHRGWVPFASTFAAFFSRAYDFIRMAGIAHANIKLCGSHCGVSIGEDGASQMALEDLAMMRAIPNAVILYPSDAVSTYKLVEAMAAYQGIAFMRSSRPKTPVLYANNEAFPIGGCKVLRSSAQDRLTLVGAGVTLHAALEASERLAQDGIQVRVIDLYSVKPVDQTTLVRCGRETNGLIMTVEDHYVEGGIGEAVTVAVNEAGIRVHRVAIREIPRAGKPEELLALYGIDADGIVKEVRAALGL
ncbi:MAG: transketolase [Fimbriimonadia bacterium]|nr:transketolase [Fimbriimonadia bacterium]